MNFTGEEGLNTRLDFKINLNILRSSDRNNDLTKGDSV